MNRKVTIHQPNYLPWLGFFSKVKHSNSFVILDNVKYTKNSVINRNKIRTKDSRCFLTIPIEKRFYNSKIRNVKLPEDNKWQEKHWRAIEMNYKRASFFHPYGEFFKELYKKRFEYLWQISEEIIFYLLKCFDIKVEITRASELELNPDLQKTDLLIAILNNVGAKTYLSGSTGKEYLDFDKFKQNNIELEFFEFTNPVYKQRFPGFEPYMAAIDLLFNMGERSGELI